MNQSGNRRYRETEHRIQTAFLSLLEEKQIDHISVQEICRAAQLARPTFYAHYEDINDLILKIECEKSTQIGAMLMQSRALTETDFRAYLRYIKENKAFYLAYFRACVYSCLSHSMMQQYCTNHQRTDLAHLKYHMLFFMAGLKTVVSEWLAQDCPESVEQLSWVLWKQYQLFADLE